MQGILILQMQGEDMKNKSNKQFIQKALIIIIGILLYLMIAAFFDPDSSLQDKGRVYQRESTEQSANDLADGTNKK